MLNTLMCLFILFLIDTQQQITKCFIPLKLLAPFLKYCKMSKSRSELRQLVRQSRKEVLSLNTQLPYKHMLVEGSQNNTVRVLSLGMVNEQSERTLLYADVDANCEYDKDKVVDWKPAFETSKVLFSCQNFVVVRPFRYFL